MKKLLLLTAFCAGIGTAANAQLQVGSVAPDFTLTDINGTSHHLYSYLDSGYAVIIDVSAAWCGPCWAAHQSHVFENLTDHYGANGTITPKKVKVIFIEGESTNTTAQLTGTSSGTSHATYSQGNWVAGTNYPIIDNNSQNNTYLYGGFPSFTIICRDRLVAAATSGYGSAMGNESWWLNIINQGCPSTAPSSTVDAKAVAYSGNDYFLCAANPTVKFQNYSATQSITSATIKVYSGSTVVATQPWTGNLAPYGVATVNVPTFTPTASQTGPFNFDVTVTGDSYAGNNAQNDIFDVATAATATTAPPFSENFESSTAMPAKFHSSGSGFFFFDGVTGSTSIIGANGSRTKCIVTDFYNEANGVTTDLVLSNYNTQSSANSYFEWDVAHAQYAASGAGSNDKLELMVSTDCGATWTSVWSKAGAILKTHAVVGTGEFIPTAAADWRHEGVSLNAYKSTNLFIKFKMTSNNGNYAFLDNFKITNTTGVNEVIAANSVKMYPNPATDMTHLAFSVTKASNVSVQVFDVMGRLISNVANEQMTAGTHQIDISTAALPAGVYNVKIQTEAGARTERLTVAK